MNVFYWSFTFQYYLRHPIKWIKELYYNIKHTLQRIIRGWADSDTWNLDQWFLCVFPQMLDALQEGNTWPGNFRSLEEWHEWLKAQSSNLKECRESNIEEFTTAKSFQIEQERRQKLIQKTFEELSKNFFSLWS